MYTKLMCQPKNLLSFHIESEYRYRKGKLLKLSFNVLNKTKTSNMERTL